jgi:hypothetical protein
MPRSTLFLAVLALFAGASGGVAATLLLLADGPGASRAEAPPAAPADTENLKETVAQLKRRLAELELQSSDNAREIRSLDRRERSETASAAPSASFPTEEEWARAAQSAFKVTVKDGKAINFSKGPIVRLAGGFGKGGELMRLSEEDRWAKIREALHLDSYQESELKQIQKDLRAEMQDMFKMDPDTGKLTSSLDFKKFREARDRADERVKNLLSQDQYDKFKKDGYSAALGMGGSSYAISYTSTTIGEEKDK